MRLWKRVTAAVTAGAMLLVSGALPGAESWNIFRNALYETVHAEDAYGELTYTKYDDHVEITGCDKSATEVEIPAEIDGVPVTSIGAEAFMYCTLTSVTIPDSVISIGDSAFERCTMGSVTIPDSVTSIGAYAFSWCDKLDSIMIPDSVISIGYGAFSSCLALSSVTISHSLTSISDYAFCNCQDLTSIIIPDSITSIGEDAFYMCGLTSITVENSNCGIYASSGTLGAPETTTIHGYENSTAQAYAKKYGRTFEVIQENKCGDNVTFTVDENGVLTISGTGDMWNNGSTSAEDGTNPFTKYRDIVTSIRIEEGVTSVGSDSFTGYTKVDAVELPDSLTRICEYAFCGCTSLKEIEIPEHVAEIQMGVFAGSKLEKITISNPECQFPYEYGSTSDTLGAAGMTTIYGHENSPAQAYAEKYGYAFEVIDSNQCGDNLYYTIKDGEVQITGTGDMWDFNNEETEVGKDKKSPFTAHKDEIASVTMDETVTSIGNQAFQNCELLSTVELSLKLTRIGTYSFDNTNIFNSQKWNEENRDAVTYVDNWVVDISSPDDNYNYNYDKYLADCHFIDVEDGVIGIADGAFSRPTVRSVALPDSIKYIGKSAFQNSTLRTITIPKNVVCINEDAFANSELYSIIFENVDTIILGNNTIPCDLIYVTDSNKSTGNITTYLKNKKILYFGNFTKLLKPEIDGTSFIHSNEYEGDGFYGISNYVISNKNLKDLLKQVSYQTDKKTQSNVYRYFSKNPDGSNKWSGSCYGIAALMALEFNYDILEGTYYEQGRPCENIEFKDIIQFLHLSQYVNIYDAYYAYNKNKKQTQHYVHNGNHTLKEVLTYIVETAQSNPNKAYILGIPGHAVTVQGCILGEDGCYHLRLFDCNSSIITDLIISLDYSKLTIVEGSEQGTESDTKKVFTENTIDYLCIVDPEKVYAYLQSSNNQYSGDNKLNIVFQDQMDFTIKKKNGEETVILSERPIINEYINEERTLISLDDSIYEIAIETMDSEMEFYDDNGETFIAYLGRNVQYVQVNPVDNMFTLTGNNMTYTAFISTGNEVAENEEGLVSVSGTANGTVTIQAENGKVTVTSEEPQSNLTISSYIGNDVIQETMNSATDISFTVEEGGTIQADTNLIAEYALGDVNADTAVNAEDAAIILTAAAQIGSGAESGLNTEQETAADVNRDGNINATDAAIILTYAAAQGTGADAKIEDFV